MDNLSRLHAFNCILKVLEQRAIVFHPISFDVDNDDTKTQFLEVVFILKTLIDSY